MKASDLWEVLAKCNPDARVVLRCEGGEEIEVASVSSHVQFLVVTPGQEVSPTAHLERDAAFAVLRERVEELNRALINAEDALEVVDGL